MDWLKTQGITLNGITVNLVLTKSESEEMLKTSNMGGHLINSAAIIF